MRSSKSLIAFKRRQKSTVSAAAILSRVAVSFVGLLALSNARLAAQEAAGSLGTESVIVTGTADRQLLLDAHSETGSRLGLTVRENPAIVDILSQEMFLERGLRTSVEVLNATPGATSGQLASSPGQLSMRGFTAGSISLLYDGIRQTNSALIIRNLDSWSFDRIEVLKGPAGVLYGEGSLAGAVNLVPKKPHFGGDAYAVTAGLGSFDSTRIGADANIVLDDAVAVRGYTSYNRSGGYVDDTDSSFFAATIATALRPTNKWSIELAVDYLKDAYGTAYWGSPLVPLAAARLPSSLVRTSNGFVLDESSRNTNYNVTNPDQGSETWWLRSRTIFEILPSLTFSNELSYYDAFRRFRNSEVYTYAAPTLAFPNGSFGRGTTRIDHDHQFFIERAVLASDTEIAGYRNRLSAGVEYSRSDFDSIRRFGTTTSVDIYDPVRGTFSLADTAANYPGAGNRANFDSTTTIKSVFLEEALNVTPEFLLIAGIRQDRIDLDRRIDDLNLGTSVPFSRSYNATSWRAGLVYDLAPKMQLFTQYSFAVAPVGSLALISATNANFNLTTGRSAEGGIKASLFEDRLDLTLAGYWIKQKNILTRDPNNFNLTIQGGSQSSLGTELSVSAAITEQFRIDLSLAILDARFDELLEAGGVSRAGNTPPVVPERVASLFGVYRFDDVPVTLTAGVRHAAAFFTDNANSVRVGSSTIFDASIGYRLPHGEIALRGRNLTDAFYANWFGGSNRQITLSAPRSFDVSYTVKF